MGAECPQEFLVLADGFLREEFLQDGFPQEGFPQDDFPQEGFPLKVFPEEGMNTAGRSRLQARPQILPADRRALHHRDLWLQVQISSLHQCPTCVQANELSTTASEQAQ